MAYINGRKVVGMMRSAGGSESSTLITTTTDATLVSGSTYELALTYLTETPKVNDFIAYVNNGAITTLYKVTAVDSTNATLTKIGDIGGGGGGKQLYQHFIKAQLYDTSNSVYVFQLGFTIVNDSNEEINTREKFKTLVKSILGEKQYNLISYGFIAVSGFAGGDGSKSIEAITMGNYNYAYSNDMMWYVYSNGTTISYGNFPDLDIPRWSYSFVDNVIAL